MARRGGWLVVFLLIVLGGGGSDGWAQPEDSAVSVHSAGEARFCEEPSGSSVDLRGLAVVYCDVSAGVAGPLRAAHATARPIFYGAVPASWVGAGLSENVSVGAAAFHLTLSQGLTYGLVLGVKHAVGRSRPYVDHPLKARSDRHRPPRPGDEHLSFPSGHAGVSAALATSWSASYPQWYVIAPGALWAVGVAASRVYLGVHYPSDVLVGTVLGAGIALLVHQLRTLVTPSPLRTPMHGVQGPPVGIRIQF